MDCYRPQFHPTELFHASGKDISCASVLHKYNALGAIYAVSLFGSVFCSERVLVLARNILAARAPLPLFGTTLAQASPPPLFCPTSPNMVIPLAFLITLVQSFAFAQNNTSSTSCLSTFKPTNTFLLFLLLLTI